MEFKLLLLTENVLDLWSNMAPVLQVWHHDGRVQELMMFDVTDSQSYRQHILFERSSGGESDQWTMRHVNYKIRLLPDSTEVAAQNVVHTLMHTARQNLILHSM